MLRFLLLPSHHPESVHLKTAIVTSLLLASLAAQQRVVSPVNAASREGNSENLFPWANYACPRYMQIHSDLTGAPLSITKLAFRMDARDTINYTAVNVVDLELFMGHGRPATSPSWFFAANYVAPATQVIARRVVNMGPQGQNSTVGPNPFTSNMELLLDAPFPYNGIDSLVWEAVIYANSVGGTFCRLDVEGSSRTNGTSTVTGAGCTATGQANPMTLAPAFADMGGTLVVNFTVADGPPLAPVILALGATNPNLAFPGLCSNLLTSLDVVFQMGVTDSAGAITFHNAGSSAFAVPNTIPGRTLFAQAHAFDPGRPDPIPFTNSQGRQLIIPTSDLSNVVLATRLFSQQGGPGATQSIFFFGTTVGHALVTEFTY
ncbi:MAG TPA: hypothetical protein VK081_15060 [Planctomycetota bacterium]|nr:hypothetical protein [Planctomycetota bacterium]